MNTAAKIQAQLHGAGAQTLQPTGSRRSHVQGHQVFPTQGRLHCRPRPQLVIGTGQANQGVPLFEEAGFDFDTAAFEFAKCAVEHTLVYLGATTGAGDLDGVIVGEKIG